jgi:hypothetical protein
MENEIPPDDGYMINSKGEMMKNRVDVVMLDKLVRELLKEEIDNIEVCFPMLDDDEKFSYFKSFVLGLLQGIYLFRRLDVIDAGNMLNHVIPAMNKVFNSENWDEALINATNL